MKCPIYGQTFTAIPAHSQACGYPTPYSVKWQVVNTGKEATDAIALRGDFYESALTDTWWETTGYKETYWVKAFILKDGDYVAKSGRKMIMVRNNKNIVKVGLFSPKKQSMGE